MGGSVTYQADHTPSSDGSLALTPGKQAWQGSLGRFPASSLCQLLTRLLGCSRYKKTIVCQEVAKAKNVCQVCLLDLEYNLPVQVRDSATGEDTEQLPQSDVGKEFQLQRMADEGELGTSYDGPRANDTILKLQRTTPYYKVRSSATHDGAKLCTSRQMMTSGCSHTEYLQSKYGSFP